MTRLTAALILFAGGLIAIGAGDHERPTVARHPQLTSGKHRSEARRTSRSMRRLPLPQMEGPLQPFAGRKARSRRPELVRGPARSHVLPTGARQLLTVTGYCSTGSRNAAGDWPTVGTAAGNAWPLGTRLHVQTVGVVVVADRSAPGATDVDLFLGDGGGCAQRAANWGRRQLLVSEVAA